MFLVEKNKLPIKSWCNAPESSAIDQASNLANHPQAVSHIALMPDTHAGTGMPIGGVAALDNAICPNMIGVDIACGMMACRTNIKKDQLTREQMLAILVQARREIPMGKNHQKDDRWRDPAVKLFDDYHEKCMLAGVPLSDKVKIEAIYSQLGTLGGGNHFIELQADEDQNVWFMLHSGSRNIGYMLCAEFNGMAKTYCDKYGIKLPSKDLAFLRADNAEGVAYLKNLEFCVNFSFQNRECMSVDFLYSMMRVSGLEIEIQEKINIHHNYAALEEHFGNKVWVHRKGATSAKLGQLGVIPGSMGTSSYIVKGKGNPDSFQSCSHGAGRTMSRTDAKKKFGFVEFKEKMEGNVSLDVDEGHIDESPMAYKDIDLVMSEQGDLIDIVHILEPLANMKG